MFLKRTFSFGAACTAVLLILVYLLAPTTAKAAGSQLSIYVNGAPSGYNAISANGHWYIKLRELCSIYCVEIAYDNAAKTITVYDKPQPTVWHLQNNQVRGQEESEIPAIVRNGAVYVPLNSVPSAGDLPDAIAAGRLNIRRSFYFNGGHWYSETGSLLSEQPGWREVDGSGYLAIKSLGSEATLSSTKIWQFSSGGICRAVAVYWPTISDFAIADNSVYIVGRDSWNSSEVRRFSLADGTDRRLGRPDYAYGDNLRTVIGSRWPDNMQPLENSGLLVREDGVYAPGYSQSGFFENNIVDEKLFAETYGYYRLNKTEAAHTKVDAWPQ